MRNIVYLLFFILLGCDSEKNSSKEEESFISNDPVLSKLKTDDEGAVSIKTLLAAAPSESELEPDPDDRVSSNLLLESQRQPDDRMSSSLPLEHQEQEDSGTSLAAPPSCSGLRTVNSVSDRGMNNFMKLVFV